MKKISEILKNSKYLSKASYIVHVIDEIENFNNPQSIFVEFDSIVGITFNCGSDGESIIYEEGSPEFVERNMGEFGREIIKDVIDRSPWKESSSSSIASIFEIKSEDIVMGYKFLFEKSEVYIINLGDEIFVFGNYPEDILKGENILLERVF